MVSNLCWSDSLQGSAVLSSLILLLLQIMDGIMQCVVSVQETINRMCEGKPAWEVVLRTAATTVLLVWTKNFLFKDESESQCCLHICCV